MKSGRANLAKSSQQKQRQRPQSLYGREFPSHEQTRPKSGLSQRMRRKAGQSRLYVETKSGQFPTSSSIRRKGRKMVVGTVPNQIFHTTQDVFVLDFAASRFSFVLISGYADYAKTLAQSPPLHRPHRRNISRSPQCHRQFHGLRLRWGDFYKPS